MTEVKELLLIALNLAKQQRGFCSPNPAVGAVVVNNQQVLATGFHRGPGTAHAEADALNQLDLSQTTGATLYVTLEPCCIHGRTPPCTDLIIKHQLAKVIYAYQDPNPKVAGKGKQLLLAAGIDCQHQPIQEIDEFYQSYHYWWQQQKPFITSKIALSKNNKYANAEHKPIQITGKVANQYTHQQRFYSDALLTTVKTIINDDPQFNVRIADKTYKKPLYILDRSLQIPEDAKIWQTTQSIILFHQADIDPKRLANLQQRGARCISVPTKDDLLDLTTIVEFIGKDGIHDLWIEVGGFCFSQFLQQGLFNKVLVYQASTTFPESFATLEIDPKLFSAAKTQHKEPLGKDTLTVYSLSFDGITT